MACDISRACKPMKLSPISPSSSALGTKAATESTTSTSILPVETSALVISRACSPQWGLRNQQAIDVHAELRA